MLVFEVEEWWWWRHRVNTLKNERIARFQGRRVVVMAAQSNHPRKQGHMLVFEVGGTMADSNALKKRSFSREEGPGSLLR